MKDKGDVVSHCEDTQQTLHLLQLKRKTWGRRLPKRGQLLRSNIGLATDSL
jgi:hypothetical protein